MQSSQSSVSLVEKLEYGNFVKPLHDKNTPIYNWYLFKHSYSKELVTNLLDAFEISQGSWVLDPFCGCGTTIAAAQSVKPVTKPYAIFSQSPPANAGLARTAPTKTAKPIIKQLTGRISRMMPLAFPI